MYMEYKFQLARDGIHKYKVTLPSGKTVKFGASGYGDYIQYSKSNKVTALIKKKSYISRHKVNENWKDLTKPGTWARYILWNKSTLHSSMRNMENKFGIRIKNVM